MRRGVLGAVLALILAVPASAAAVHPRALVLQRADVPAEFVLDRAESGVRRNDGAFFPDGDNEAFVARSGRITGYVAQYVKRGRDVGIQSSVDVFRRPVGARMMLVRVHGWWRRLGGGNPGRRGDISAESWVYAGSIDTVVLWRFGRIYGSVLGFGLSEDRTLALARVQQRRIAAALR
jgi:hypothetical protein